MLYFSARMEAVSTGYCEGPMISGVRSLNTHAHDDHYYNRHGERATMAWLTSCSKRSPVRFGTILVGALPYRAQKKTISICRHFLHAT